MTKDTIAKLQGRSGNIGGRYKLIRKIGNGGMSNIYMAQDLKANRTVAVKILNDHLSRNKDIQKRFQTEVRILSRVNHPNILKIYDSCGPGATPLWFASEYIEGKTLEEIFKSSNKKIHPMIATFFVCEIAKALEEIHKHEVIHRDIKPSNIMLQGNGKLKLLDFGISKDIQESSGTVTKVILGTPHFISPEQRNCERIDVRTDIYSLSVIYFYLLTGELPYNFKSEHEFLTKELADKISPRGIVTYIPIEMDKIVQKGLRKDRENRFSSVTMLRQRLEQVIRDFGFESSDKELKRMLKSPKKYQSYLKQRCGNRISFEVKHNIQDDVKTAFLDTNPQRQSKKKDNDNTLLIDRKNRSTIRPDGYRHNSPGINQNRPRSGTSPRLAQSQPPKSKSGGLTWIAVLILIVLGGAYYITKNKSSSSNIKFHAQQGVSKK